MQQKELSSQQTVNVSYYIRITPGLLVVAFQIPSAVPHTLHNNPRYHLASFRFNIITYHRMMPASFNSLLIATGNFLAHHNWFALQVKVKHTT